MATSPRKLTVPVLALLAVASLAAASGCTAGAEPAPGADEPTADGETGQTGQTSAELRIRGGLGADGDSCTVRTNPDGTSVPGTEKDGDCCSNTDPSDCVVILKPFPKVTYSFSY